MSAISGLVDLSGIQKEEVNRMKRGLDGYRFDQRNSVEEEDMFFDCGIQWITEESKSESLPYINEQFCLTADAIIDNRQELMELLHIKEQIITDSQLILASYIRWKDECVHYLLGDYAFAIWDRKEKRLFCVRDHVGKRTLYYEHSKGKISFSTILKPLVNLQGKRKKLNEKWLTDFLALESVTQEVEIDKTLYEGINQLPPGHYLVFDQNAMTLKRYWHPECVKKIKLESDEAYEEAFRKVFDEAVRCRIRSCGKIGIMLSSGLDSTAVGAVAAQMLAIQGKNLEAFTEIPVSKYKSDLSKSVIVNEKSYVEEMAKQYPNIHNHFSSYDEHNSYKDIEAAINELERPYKAVENIYWITSLTKEAAANGCKVLLDGQFGNYTISQGYALTYWHTLFKSFHWFELMKEIKAFGRKMHIGRKYLYKVLFKTYWQDLKRIFQVNKRQLSKIVNKDLASKWCSFSRIKKKGFKDEESRLYDYKKQNEMITNLILLSYLGCMETNTSLVDGLLRRDPTRDKRVIEFCMSIPASQYVHRGEERSLIRRAMKGDVPDCIRLNFRSRGRQAADWRYRLIPHQEEIAREIEKIIEDRKIQKYIDKETIENYLRKLKAGIDQQQILEKELRELFYIIIFSRFIRQY